MVFAAPPGRFVITVVIAYRQDCSYIARMKVVADKTYQMRVTDEFLRTIDEWRRQQPDIPPRAEAIRRLIELGLQASKAEPKS